MHDISMQVNPDFAMITFDYDDTDGTQVQAKVAVHKDGRIASFNSKTGEQAEHESLEEALKDAPAQEVAELTVEELAAEMKRNMEASWTDFDREAQGLQPLTTEVPEELFEDEPEKAYSPERTPIPDEISE